MKELKVLKSRDLIKLRATRQVANQIACMINKVVRDTPNHLRYKIVNALTSLFKIDKITHLKEVKLNHHGGADVVLGTFVPRFMDDSHGYISFSNNTKNISEFHIRWRSESIDYLLPYLLKIRKILMMKCNFSKKELPKCDYAPFIIEYDDDNSITFASTKYYDNDYTKYKVAYDILHKSKIEYSPNIKIRKDLVKFYFDDKCAFYVDTANELIVTRKSSSINREGYIFTKRELTNFVKGVKALGGIE